MPRPLRLHPSALSLLVIACFLVIGSAAAQTTADDNTLRDDAWALQFRVTDNFTLGSFDGSLISAKHHFTDRRALRYGLSLGASREDDGTDERTQQLLVFGVDFLDYPGVASNPSGTMQLYWGGGPSISFQRSESEPIMNLSWGVGLGGVIGAEWFVRPRLSLLAEYSAALQIQRATQEVDGTETNERTDVRFGGNGVRFGVSAYLR